MENEEDGGNKLLKKIKKDPMIPLGMAGLTGIVIYGFYNLKKKGTDNKSLYFVNLRVTAQGTLLACVTLGLIYQLCDKHLGKLMGQNKKN